MNSLLLVLIINILVISSSGNHNVSQTDRYVIACHTTDFECFKRQFRALRDKFLLGNMELGIDFYEPYKYRYGDTGTCIMFSGVEDSELVGISLDAKSLQFTMTIETTLNIHQIMNATVCDVPKEGSVNDPNGILSL
ncbi:putative Transmembrane protein [Operophtera brumata]|uniref:Putative Transmembrane protein n=1 Tax=Operophtera brumata TaxID=104452 RepID=A0A0L7LNW0_OPEBR|nr:putative Transmembrane protein [Operophtera brumata]